MTVEEFDLLATDCGYSFSCSNVTQGDIDMAIAYVKNRTGFTYCSNNPYSTQSTCGCEIGCAIVYYVYLTKEVSPNEEELSVERYMLDYLQSKGLLSFGY